MAGGQAQQLGDDLLAEADAAVIRKDGDVADIRAIHAVGHRAPCPDQLAVVMHEAAEHAVAERGLQVGGAACCPSADEASNSADSSSQSKSLIECDQVNANVALLGT